MSRPVHRREFGRTLLATTTALLGCSPSARVHPGDAGDEDTSSVDAETGLECPTGPRPPLTKQPMPSIALSAYFGGRGAFREGTLCEYYDPDGTRGIHALLIVVSAVWCGPCNEYTPWLQANFGPYLARGARLLDLLVEDGFHKPPKQATVDQWIERHALTADAGLASPADFFYAGKENYPTSYIVDPRTMALTAKRGGFDLTILPNPSLVAVDELLVKNGH